MYQHCYAQSLGVVCSNPLVNSNWEYEKASSISRNYRLLISIVQLRLPRFSQKRRGAISVVWNILLSKDNRMFGIGASPLPTDCIPLYSAKSERSTLCHFPWVSLCVPKWYCESVQSNIVNLQVSDDSILTQ